MLLPSVTREPAVRPATTRMRVLEPIDRISEALFALIMVLTFTGSPSAAQAGRADVVAVTIALGG